MLDGPSLAGQTTLIQPQNSHGLILPFLQRSGMKPIKFTALLNMMARASSKL